jgi:hypothetical protein
VAGEAWAGDRPSSGSDRRRRGDKRHMKKQERVGSINFFEPARSGYLRNIIFSGTASLLSSPTKRA